MAGEGSKKRQVAKTRTIILSTRHLVITVACLTRKRPIMLRALIESWAALVLPEGTTTRFLVVENDELPVSLEIVRTLRTRFPEVELQHLLEPRPGIPVARNRALDYAIDMGSDLLCFVDDDEEVSASWLCELVSKYRIFGAVAIGGPVLPRKPREPLDAKAEAIFSGVKAQSEARNRRFAERSEAENFRHVTVATNNCLYDLNVVGRGGLRFDETMVWSGGTDAKLSAEIAHSGHSLGWAKSAIVWETQPATRLTPSYIIKTTRDRAAVYIERKLRENRLYVLAIAPILVVRLTVYALLLPASLFGGAAYFSNLHNTGWILAILRQAIRKKSTRYRNITGY